MGAVPQFGFMGIGGHWCPPNNSRMFFETIIKCSYKENGLTGDFGEVFIIFGQYFSNGIKSNKLF